MTDADERAAFVALALTPGIGASRLHALLHTFDTALGALSAPFALLCTVPGLSRAAATAVAAARPADGARALRDAAAQGAVTLLSTDSGYPAVLHQIPSPPPLLFALGDLRLLDRGAVAVVGSRGHTSYGASICRMVVDEAVGAGLVVVSGMARGLDAVAHARALEIGGGTIGVLGNGLGVVYPAANRALYERVAGAGLLLTEFPPGERPHAGSFPRRNRLISGLSAVTVVVEAAAGSGALITVDAALEQGREVIAVPGPITSAVSVGTNRLLRDGATPYLEPGDLLRHFPGLAGRAARPEPTEEPSEVEPEWRPVLAAIGGEDVALDALAERLERPVAELLSLLCALELAGLVEQGPGPVFRRTSQIPGSTRRIPVDAGRVAARVT